MLTSTLTAAAATSGALEAASSAPAIRNLAVFLMMRLLLDD
jgi:hypothetical protein